MKNLSEHLKYYISHRISTNGRWQSIKVVYSGPEVNLNYIIFNFII
jgi:5'-3' exonuclease